MAETAYSLFSLVLILAAAYGVGQPLARALGPRAEDTFEQTTWSLAWGLVVWGMGLMVLGFIGLLYAPLIGVVTWAAAFAALGQFLSSRRALPETMETQTLSDSERKLPRTVILLGVLTAVAVCCSLAQALVPATAGDALCYHLELPKRFLAEHRLTYSPDCDNCTFPLLAETWFAWAMALDGAVAAQLVHWALGLLWAAATVMLARPVVGRAWAWGAGALVLLVPGVTCQMGVALNDAACAAFTTLGLAAWYRTVHEDQPRSALAAGAWFGAAVAVKYIALVFGAAVALVWLVQTVRRRNAWRPALVAAAGAAVMVATVAGPWYARSAWYRGNPVWPFFSELAGESGTSTLRESKLALGHSIPKLMAAPWFLTMEPERFGGRGHQWGPMWLMLLPGVLLVRRLRHLPTLLALAAIHVGVCLLLRQNLRFLLPALAPLAVAAVWCWWEVQRMTPWPRRFAYGTLVALLLLTATVPVLRLRHSATWWTGDWDRHTYLLDREPSYMAAFVCNDILPPHARVLSQEHRAFYFEMPVVRESIFRRRTGYDGALEQPGELAAVLESAGFTHLLLAESLTPGGLEYEPTLTALAESAQDAAPGSLRCLCQLTATDADGDTRRYRLIALHPR